MMRLPRFRYHAPRTVQEAAELLARGPGEAMLVAGGTDLLPNMKRRQQVPTTLIGLRQIAALRQIANGDGLTIGAGLTLTSLLDEARVRDSYAGLWQAAAQVATPLLRNMGTLGGNICLDTRCNYWNQNYEWRKAIDFCMKKDGRTCWVATSSPRCLAVSSTDTAPALVALGASVTLASAEGTRRIPLATLYQNDGINYLTRRPTEVLTKIHLPRADGWRSAYWKLRRRGSFDFPVLGAAAASLLGQPLTPETIARAAELAAQPARPMDNTDFSLVWRKRVTRDFVSYALAELRGDDVRELRKRITRQLL